MNEDMELCTRCETEVETDTLTTFGTWRLCEDCMGDM